MQSWWAQGCWRCCISKCKPALVCSSQTPTLELCSPDLLLPAADKQCKCPEVQCGDMEVLNRTATLLHRDFTNHPSGTACAVNPFEERLFAAAAAAALAANDTFGHPIAPHKHGPTSPGSGSSRKLRPTVPPGTSTSGTASLNPTLLSRSAPAQLPLAPAASNPLPLLLPLLLKSGPKRSPNCGLSPA